MVRVDANGGWGVAEGGGSLTADGPLEYRWARMPSQPELSRVAPAGMCRSRQPQGRDRVAVVRSDADVAVLKVAPLGGISALLDIAGSRWW